MQIVGIALRSNKRIPMQEVPSGYIHLISGLSGDFRSQVAKSDRKITLLSSEQWAEACAELGAELPWYERRANICISGENFGPEHVGQQILFGKSVVLRVTGQTEPCQRMDEVRPGLKEALAKNWRGGVTCFVVQGGDIKVGTFGRFDLPATV